MNDFLQGLRQRKLVQWSIGYLAAAWVALEVLGTLGDMWGWPAVVGRIAFVLLAVGFAVAVVLGWYHGEGGRQHVTAAEVVILLSLAACGVFGVARVARPATSPELGGPAIDHSVSGASLDDRSLVVLPFADLSPEGGREYLGDGIAETLISGLGRVEELRVVAPTSAFQFKGLGLDIREIGRRLGVGSVLDGSVTQIGNRVRITAGLYDATTGLNRWSERFDKEVEAEDLFVLQDEVAQTILAALKVELGSQGRVVPGGTRSPEAQRAYYLGMHHWTARTTEDIARATEYFHEAIVADSTYADAWAGLALSYILHVPSEYDVPGLTPTEALDRAEAAARRAMELDPTLAAPHTALGDALRLRGRPEEAVKEFRRGIEKNPGYATAHHWLADLLMVLQRGEEALAEMEIAETLDPVAPAIVTEKGEALMVLGRHQEAMAQMDRALQLHPEQPLVVTWSAWFAFALEDWDRAASHLALALELFGEPSETIQRVESELRDPVLRPAFLRDLADGRVAGYRSGVGSLSSPQNRFHAMLKVDGPKAALRYLESAIRGSDRMDVYAPLLPAMMGPELTATPEAQHMMQLLINTPEG